MKVWNLGYPRVGKKRELKKALETFWAGESSYSQLEETYKTLCTTRWARQRELGVESVPVNDFSLYDHMLDTSLLLGAVPKRFQGVAQNHWMDLYFAMARGVKGGTSDVPPMDMTKWFNTNYHYLVPEINQETVFSPNLEKLTFEIEHAKAHGVPAHVVLVGPWTYVRLSKLEGITPAQVFEKILPVYQHLLSEIRKLKVEWIQIDEPALCQDNVRDDLRVARKIYETLGATGASLCLTTYFESPDPWLSEISNFPVSAIHFDLVHGGATWQWLKTRSFPESRVLSLGLVSGRNIWAAPLSDLRKETAELLALYPYNVVWLAPSCSLLHLPHDKTLEKKWDPEFSGWISFADQRLEELALLKRALQGDKTVEASFAERDRILRARGASSRIHRSEVKQAVERIDAQMKTRKTPFEKRVVRQKKSIGLNLLPTTTIGSFPQTVEIRKARQQLKKKALSPEQYQQFLEKEIEHVIRFQEQLGLDILVHGESERNDMVEYFAEWMDGYAFSDHGWVQSYGSRCVKPPILFGDVKRKGPMTVKWFQFAQSTTSKPVKGMLTGPVTMLNWSFVREDQPKDKTAYQLALAIREEVGDLEAKGAKVIQIDEAALREGLPMKRLHWNRYLTWAVDSFRICTSALKDETQVHTHMCYSEFGDIMDAITRLDADVLLIENARSGESFFQCFKNFNYPNHIGPGVYDIHSPRVPSEQEIEDGIVRILTLFPPDRVWINPDCGLKTRGYSETEATLKHMVAAASRVRARIAEHSASFELLSKVNRTTTSSPKFQ